MSQDLECIRYVFELNHMHYNYILLSWFYLQVACNEFRQSTARIDNATCLVSFFHCPTNWAITLQFGLTELFNLQARIQTSCPAHPASSTGFYSQAAHLNKSQTIYIYVPSLFVVHRKHAKDVNNLGPYNWTEGQLSSYYLQHLLMNILYNISWEDKIKEIEVLK